MTKTLVSEIIDSIAFKYYVIIQKAFCTRFWYLTVFSPKLSRPFLKPSGHFSHLILPSQSPLTLMTLPHETFCVSESMKSLDFLIHSWIHINLLCILFSSSHLPNFGFLWVSVLDLHSFNFYDIMHFWTITLIPRGCIIFDLKLAFVKTEQYLEFMHWFQTDMDSSICFATDFFMNLVTC